MGFKFAGQLTVLRNDAVTVSLFRTVTNWRLLISSPAMAFFEETQLADAVLRAHPRRVAFVVAQLTDQKPFWLPHPMDGVSPLQNALVRWQAGRLVLLNRRGCPVCEAALVHLMDTKMDSLSRGASGIVSAHRLQHRHDSELLRIASWRSGFTIDFHAHALLRWDEAGEGPAALQDGVAEEAWVDLQGGGQGIGASGQPQHEANNAARFA